MRVSAIAESNQDPNLTNGSLLLNQSTNVSIIPLIFRAILPTLAKKRPTRELLKLNYLICMRSVVRYKLGCRNVFFGTVKNGTGGR